MKRFFVAIFSAPEAVTPQEFTDQLDVMTTGQGVGVMVDGVFTVAEEAREAVHDELCSLALDPADADHAAKAMTPAPVVFMN